MFVRAYGIEVRQHGVGIPRGKKKLRDRFRTVSIRWQNSEIVAKASSKSAKACPMKQRTQAHQIDISHYPATLQNYKATRPCKTSLVGYKAGKRLRPQAPFALE